MADRMESLRCLDSSPPRPSWTSQRLDTTLAFVSTARTPLSGLLEVLDSNYTEIALHFIVQLRDIAT